MLAGWHKKIMGITWLQNYNSDIIDFIALKSNY
jgi:hypothetical protein